MQCKQADLRKKIKKFKKLALKPIAIYRTHAIITKQTMRNKKNRLKQKFFEIWIAEASLIKQNTTGVNELLIKFGDLNALQ